MTWHVVPLNDLREHTYSEACWCKPEVHDAPDWSRPVCVHNSMDRREYTVEQGKVQ
ncbi:hypothetical protein [Novosphingobium sp. FKTRR1]|uniref:hypothetical protein n=1 Tax=Novosphingobium sp. FKTRR1 TaxID=2879118 RepID=UPI001CF0A2B9|nr:hypothetical protein [Novosphingobium sp. FKTRR1]